MSDLDEIDDGATTLLGMLLIVGSGFTLALYMISLTDAAAVRRSEGRLNMTTDQLELYRSPNGDAWFLARNPANQKAFIIHEPNKASGGQPARIEIGEFLRSGAEGPEHQGLLRLIGTLVPRG